MECFDIRGNGNQMYNNSEDSNALENPLDIKVNNIKPKNSKDNPLFESGKVFIDTFEKIDTQSKKIITNKIK